MDELRMIRISKRLTQPEAAKKIGVSVATYKGWENGTWQIPALKVDSVLKILRGR